MKELKKQLDKIENNDLVHIQRDVTNLSVEQAKHGVDIKWLKENHRFVKYTVIGSLLAGLIGILLDLILK